MYYKYFYNKLYHKIIILSIAKMLINCKIIVNIILLYINKLLIFES